MKVSTFQWVILGIVVAFGIVGSTGRPGALLVSFVLAALLIVVSLLDWGNDDEFMDEVPRKYHKVDFSQEGYGGKPEEVPREQANVISSIGTDGLHYPVLDLDIPAFLVPSSTPGHSHLYLNIGIDPDTYFELLEVLSRAGILEEGYVSASEARQYTAVRPPWVKKVQGEAEEAEKAEKTESRP